jgi:hypothetical protein
LDPALVARTVRLPNSGAAVASVPHPASALVGREHELRKVRQLLEHDGVALVTLTGPGGIGKTRLAVELGHVLRERYGDGVVFVPLAGVRDADLVVPTIAAVLGAVEFDHRASLKGLKVHLRDRRMLLLLDNFEQVSPAGPIVAELLAASPRLQIIVTSRARLRLSGEHEFRIGGLSLPKSDDRDLETSNAAPAVALVVRGRPGRHSWRTAAISDICARRRRPPIDCAARVRLIAVALGGWRVVAVLTEAMDRPPQRTVRGVLGWIRHARPAAALFADCGVQPASLLRVEDARR